MSNQRRGVSYDSSFQIEKFFRLTLLEQPKHVDSRNLLREIVRLDFRRILSRLRSKHAKLSGRKAGKPVLGTQLGKAISSVPSGPNQPMPAAELSFLKTKAKVLQNLCSAVEALPRVGAKGKEVIEVLMNIVECAHEVVSDDKLSYALATIQLMDPSTRIHLSNAINKLGRYYSASRDLIQAARTKNYSIFGKIVVEQYRIYSPPQILSTEEPLTLQSSINNLIEQESTLKKHVPSFSAERFLGETYERKSEDFTSHISRPGDLS